MDDPGLRQAGLIAGLLFCVGLGYMTIHVAVTDGPSALTIASLLVIALIASGLYGALRNPPE